MAEDNAEVKSGPGLAASVAIATAIIGAVTTISVAYINSDGPSGAPAERVEPVDNRDVPQPVDPTAPTDEAFQTDEVQQFAAPVVANVAGVWRAQDGEELEIGQSGTRLTFATVTMSGAGPISAQGVGRIDDRNLSWSMQLYVQGQQVETDCNGRLTTSGRSLQGACELMGQKVPFIYTK